MIDVEPAASTVDARITTCGMFFTFGFTVAAWIAGVPGLQRAYQLNDAQLGLLMLTYGLTNILMAYPNSRLVDAVGPRRTTFLSVPTSTACMSCLGLLSHLEVPYRICVPFLIVLVGGLFGSAYCTAFTVKGTRLEQELGRSVMSSFHACFSLGALVGSQLFSFMLKMQVPWHVQYPAQITLSAVLTVALTYRSVDEQPRRPDFVYSRVQTPVSSTKDIESDASSAPRPANEAAIDWQVVAVGCLSAMALFVEMSVGDWGALYYMRYARATMSQGPYVYSAMAASMIPMRLIGDTLADRWGRQKVFRFGGLMSFTGFTCLLFAPSLWFSPLCGVLIGCGLANNVPILQTCAARSEKMSIPQVTATLGALNSAAMLGGPSIIGPFSHRFGLRTALLLPLSATLALASGTRLLYVNRHPHEKL